MKVKSFTFNLYQENTFILYDDSKEAILIDPGAYEASEKRAVVEFLDENELSLKRIILTHCHIDHIFGNAYFMSKYKLPLEAHKLDLPNLHAAPPIADAMGLKMTPSPEPEKWLNDGDLIEFGNSKLEVLFTPGHSAGGISFYSKDDGILIAGDLIFYSSVGRVDLPGGNAKTLLNSVREKIFTLPDETIIFSGHGPKTTVGFEKKNNPFVGEKANINL